MADCFLILIKEHLAVKIVDNKENCCGCSACKNVCPVGAIRMESDDEGFLYPTIDEIKCEKCTSVCFYKNGFTQQDMLRKAYAARLVDMEMRMECQSGGMFWALAKQYVQNGGIVYGCALNEEFRAVHMRASSIGGLKKFRGSKYVQSDTQDCYKSILSDLQSGKNVMFSGTPCQGEGVLQMLNGRYRDKIFIVDIVCHGVPSPAVWHSYIDYVAQKIGKITKVSFRDKRNYGWHSHVESLWAGTKKYSKMAYTDMFYSHLMMRPSCYKCKFTNLRRNTDITICDCWGIEKNCPDFDDNKGVSYVMPHTEVGKMLFEILRQKNIIDVMDIDYRDYMQPQMQQPIDVDLAERRQFWRDYHEYGMNDKLIAKYTRYNWKGALKEYVKNLCRRIFHS